MSKVMDLQNKVFGKLMVLKRMGSNKHGQAIWLCRCGCGSSNDVIVTSADLLSGHSSSCGCIQSQRTSEANKKYNKYDLKSEEYGIGYTFKNEEFYFDKEDFNLIKSYCWRLVNGGYVASETLDGRLYLHRLDMNLGFSNNEKIDHENRIKYDNRKENLRVATPLQNVQNIGLRKNNKSGVTGVQIREDKNGTVYIATIKVNKVKNYLLLSYNFEEAVKSRLLAEKYYFGEFAPQRHLFNQYGIEE